MSFPIRSAPPAPFLSCSERLLWGCSLGALDSKAVRGCTQVLTQGTPPSESKKIPSKGSYPHPCLSLWRNMGSASEELADNMQF